MAIPCAAQVAAARGLEPKLRRPGERIFRSVSFLHGNYFADVIAPGRLRGSRPTATAAASAGHRPSPPSRPPPCVARRRSTRRRARGSTTGEPRCLPREGRFGASPTFPLPLTQCTSPRRSWLISPREFSQSRREARRSRAEMFSTLMRIHGERTRCVYGEYGVGLPADVCVSPRGGTAEPHAVSAATIASVHSRVSHDASREEDTPGRRRRSSDTITNSCGYLPRTTMTPSWPLTSNGPSVPGLCPGNKVDRKT